MPVYALDLLGIADESECLYSNMYSEKANSDLAVKLSQETIDRRQ